MEREISLEDLSNRHPDVAKELPEGSMVVEKPPSSPSPLKRTATAVCTNVIIPVIISIMLLFAAPYILSSAPSWLVNPAQAEPSPE